MRSCCQRTLLILVCVELITITDRERGHVLLCSVFLLVDSNDGLPLPGSSDSIDNHNSMTDPFMISIFTTEESLVIRLQRHMDVLSSHQQSVFSDTTFMFAWHFPGLPFFSSSSSSSCFSSSSSSVSSPAYLSGRNVSVVVQRSRQTCGDRHTAGFFTSEWVIWECEGVCVRARVWVTFFFSFPSIWYVKSDQEVWCCDSREEGRRTMAPCLFAGLVAWEAPRWRARFFFFFFFCSFCSCWRLGQVSFNASFS